MSIFSSPLHLLAVNDNRHTERMPSSLQKKTKKASIKKLIKHFGLSRNEANLEYSKLCKRISIECGKHVLALRFEYAPESQSLVIHTYV